MNLDKLNNETEEQYIWRLGEAKSSGILALNWDELADVLNRNIYGEDFEAYKGSCAYRKTYQCAKRFYDAGVFDTKLGSNHLNELDEQKNEIIKEKRKLYDQRREYNKLLMSDARAEHLSDELVKAAQKLNMEQPLNFDDIIMPTNTEKEALLLFSDWHYGMVTDNLWNKYDTRICRERVKKMVGYTKKYLVEHGISTLHVAMLGDAAHGAIHVTCRVKSEEDTCDQLMHVSEILAEALTSLSSVVNEVKVYSCYGNHMRTIQNKKESIRSDNMEKIIPWWLKQRLSDNHKIEIIESPYKEFTRLNILGSEICCVHGDLDSFRNLGVTVNTLFTKLYGETIDYTFSGDKHHLEEFDSFGIESVLVRSLCGTDDYANDKRLYSDAGQTLVIFNNDFGRECTYHIPLD